MKILGILLLAVLASSVMVPRAFSDDNGDKKALHEKLDFNQFSDQTTNLSFADFSDQTNAGQQISSFEHKAREHFKQEKEAMIKTIKECREKIKKSSPQDRKAIKEECNAKIKAIKEQLKEERKKFQEQFKEFRQNIIASKNFDRSKLAEIKNHSISKVGHKLHNLKESKHGHKGQD